MDDTSAPTIRFPKEAKARQEAISAQIRGLLKDLHSTWLSHHMIDNHAEEISRLLTEMVDLAHERKGRK